MKKTIKLIDLDCGHCATKIENAVKKIDGVTNVSVSFIKQKMDLEAPDRCHFCRSQKSYQENRTGRNS